MDFEIIIRNATLTEAKEIFAAIPARIPIKVTQTEVTGSQPDEVPVQHVPAYAAMPWEQAEKDLVRSCKGGREAVDTYFKKFPDSKRKRSAVQKMWSTFNAAKSKNKPSKILVEEYDGEPEVLIEVNQSVESIPLINEQKDPVETISAHIVEEKKPGIDMRNHPKKAYHSKWNIPFDGKTDNANYQTAWNLCRKYNLPYPEAKLKAEAEGIKLAPEPKVKAATVTMGDMGMVTIPLSTLVTMDEIPKSESVVGWKVKQIKADRGRTIPGILLVTARRNGLIECLHKGKRQVIDATCLEVVERV
jgi:hypothetical protein